MTKMRTWTLALALVALLALRPAAQGSLTLPLITVPDGPPVDPNLRFEAAVIKPAGSGISGTRILTRGGRFEMVGFPARVLLRNALRVQDDRMSGAPAWADSERHAFVPCGRPTPRRQTTWSLKRAASRPRKKRVT